MKVLSICPHRAHLIPGIGNRASAMFGQHGPRWLVLGPAATVYRRAIGE